MLNNHPRVITRNQRMRDIITAQEVMSQAIRGITQQNLNDEVE